MKQTKNNLHTKNLGKLTPGKKEIGALFLAALGAFVSLKANAQNNATGATGSNGTNPNTQDPIDSKNKIELQTSASANIADGMLVSLDSASIKENMYIDIDARLSNLALVSKINGIISSGGHAKWPAGREFIDSIAAKIPNFEVLDYIVNDGYEFYKMPHGFYQPSSDSVFVALFSPGNKITNEQAFMTKEARMGSYKQMFNVLNFNACLTAIHELKHIINRLLYAKIGFTVSEFAEINIHDEISARIAELLFMRDIYMSTGDIKEAFAGPNEMNRCDLTQDNPRIGTDYEKYIKKIKTLPPVPTQEEMLVIIKTAIKMMSMGQKQYAKAIPPITEFDIKKSTDIFKSIRKGSDKKLSTELMTFADAVSATYAFDIYGENVNLYNESTKSELDKFIKSFQKNEFFKPEFAKVESRWAWQNDFARGLHGLLYDKANKDVESILTGNPEIFDMEFMKVLAGAKENIK